MDAMANGKMMLSIFNMLAWMRVKQADADGKGQLHFLH